MKKISILLLSLFTTISFSQTDDIIDSSDSMSKFYFGIGLGVAIPGGDLAENLEVGLDLQFINLGYRFSETWGATLNLVSSGHLVDGTDATFGFGFIGIGPMFTQNLSEKISWDFKPQLALNVMGLEVEEGYEDYEYEGSGFVIGNSLVFGSPGKGFNFSINLDGFFGKITEQVEPTSIKLTDNNSVSNIKIGVGVRYNF